MLMQQLVDRSMPDDLYWELNTEARTDRKKRKEEGKRKGKISPKRVSTVERPQSANIADLKKRIFNANVSRENVIKALEALSAAERKKTIARFPPGLRRKLGHYLREEH